MTGGYHGRVLHVDLTSGSARVDDIPDDVLRRLIGGVGIGAWLLHSEAPRGVKPFAPEAPVVFSLSPLVGTPLTTSAKFAVIAKSPLTNRICDALASDRFAIELKACGIDALVVRGTCPDWSVLVVDDGDVRIETTPELAGLSSTDAEESIRSRLGERFRFFGIGPAGERLVRYATISGDSRHAGRGGLGAVFGSKLLKGVVARGKQRTPLADAESVIAFARDLSKRSLGPATAKYRELGTVTNLLVMNRLSALPTRNFSTGSFDGAERVSGEALHALPSVRKHCAACTIGCEHVFATKSGKQVRMEYEGLFALGPLCGIDDRDAVLESAALCDELGLDVISAGGTIAFAMDCRRRGLLDAAPQFGDAAGVQALLRDIAERRGLGELLADGSMRAAQAIGGEAPRFAAHVKGMELPGYEPRALQTMALGLAVAARGADHNRSGAYEHDLAAGENRLSADASKGPAAVATEMQAAVLDSLILCKFLRGVFEDVYEEGAAMLSAVTGWDIDGDELRRAGRRIVTLRKLYNVREGWTRAEDTLPDRFLDEPLELGDGVRATLSREGLARMIASYYEAQGWAEDGGVPPALVTELCLDDLTCAGAPTR